MRRELGRKEFLRLGVAGVAATAGVLGVSGGLGRPTGSRSGRSVRVTDPEFGARGDGRADDAPAIRKALADPSVREVIFPRNPGYAIDMGRDGWSPLPLRSDVRLVGYDLEGPLIRAGRFVNNRFMFMNAHANTHAAAGVYATGNHNIEMRSLCIVGRMQDVRLVELDDPEDPRVEATVNTAVAVRSERAHGRSRGFKLLGCRILDWPGVAVSCDNLEDFALIGNRISRAHRGGLILNFVNARGTVRDNVVLDAGDHAIGFNADGNDPVPEERGPSVGVRVKNNDLSRVIDGSRTPGPVLAVRGGNGIVIEENRFLGGMASAVYLEECAGFGCRRIAVRGNRMQNCRGGALVARSGVQGSASRNTSENCSAAPEVPVYRNQSAAFAVDGTNDLRS